jgi:hypothetical protein
LGWTFFGLTQSDKLRIFSQIHEIVFHGNGGYDWGTVYNMPIWLRNFTFNKLKEHYEKVNNTNDPPSKSRKIQRPNIKQGYSTKASNK